MVESWEFEVEGPGGVRQLSLSNPEKVYFPERGFTKRQLVEYYLTVAEPLLGAVGDRPTTLKRYPGGVTSEPFYAKRVPKGAPEWVGTARVAFPSGRTAWQVCPGEPAVLAWAAGLGTLDFHPWPVRSGDTDHPDEVRVDLDPQPGTDFTDAVRVAGVLREVLDEAGLAGFPKTSGGRGVHVLVRIAPRWDFIQVRRAVIALAREVQRRIPELATVEWWKVDRGERVFLDFNQAARDRTVASAWSVRGTPRATVSTPVTWEQLGEVDPDDFDLATAPQWLAEHGDAHATLDDVEHSLDVLLDWYARDESERGLGEMPYPPDYPKMPGEPTRSRKA
ncbi:ATP-dependent DNA ligase [Allosaccharopolyspora coralli]|uniref:ATP-dependent DNA ligase n=1 Tax=Allosaccharopolyspora coralli TaxID=2665642 RepID=A0A5Q3Q8I8_9PSEU|nr:DNA polymerase domain-containing protein [Allosaccharopolyspora coralli]QGK69514.1 ATP-dependent DNA ligase [Allosaccharopolyspora coralli]